VYQSAYEQALVSNKALTAAGFPLGGPVKPDRANLQRVPTSYPSCVFCLVTRRLLKEKRKKNLANVAL